MNKGQLKNFAPYNLSLQFHKLNFETNSQYYWVLETTGLYIHHPQFLYNTLGEALKGVLPSSYYNDAVPVYLLDDFILGTTGYNNIVFFVGKSTHYISGNCCVNCGLDKNSLKHGFCEQELRDLLLNSSSPWKEFYRYDRRLNLHV